MRLLRHGASANRSEEEEIAKEFIRSRGLEILARTASVSKYKMF
jgi:hypothetical protein